MIRVKAFIRQLLNWVFGIIPSIFRTLEMILLRLQARLTRYGQNLLFTNYEVRFTTLSVLFLEHWRLFYVYWRYGCQNTGKIIYSPALKLGLRHHYFYFFNIGCYFSSN